MKELNKETVWHETLESIKVSVSSAIFSTWFSKTHLSTLKEEGERLSAVVGCESTFVKGTMELRYFGLIQDTLTKTVGKPCDLSFTVEMVTKESKDEVSPLFSDGGVSSEGNISQALEASGITGMRKGFTFESFAVSSSNQMAYAAAEAVSDSPGTAYNPLFLYGGVGVGKTHLMVAVAHNILKREADTKALFCTGEDFTNDIVEGIRNKTTQAFRNKYRKLSVLLIDDIQFIAGKDAVQEEFFHTFNAVTSAGGQIILTSDRPPSEISKLEERLRSRFEAGLIVDIAPPDFELRCAITQIKSQQKGINLPMDLIQLIAGNIDSARKLEGFLVTLSNQVNIKRVEVTEELIKSLLNKSGEEANGKTIKASPNDVITAVSKHFGIGRRSLLGPSRVRTLARPRQLLMYILRHEMNLSLEEVGRLIGGRDHTTVMHAVETITTLTSTDVNIRGDLMGIKKSL